MPDRALADGLAAWLERLGLADQLGPAGLPVFGRDDDGHAQWRERNGSPLSPEALARLDEVLRSDGDDPSHAVPIALVRLRRQTQVRARLLDGGWLDYAGLGALRGTSENAARFSVHKAAERGGVLLVAHDVHTLVPTFQLDDAGQVRAELLPLLEPLLAAPADPWWVWGWFTEPAALLGGAVPHEAARDPEELPALRHAVVRLAERVRASG